MKGRPGQLGNSYTEVLVATVLLGMVLMISAGTLVRGRGNLLRLERAARALEAMETEIDHLRGAGDLLPGMGIQPWISNAVVDSGLPHANGSLEILPGPFPDLLQVRVMLRRETVPLMTRTILLRGVLK